MKTERPPETDNHRKHTNPVYKHTHMRDVQATQADESTHNHRAGIKAVTWLHSHTYHGDGPTVKVWEGVVLGSIDAPRIRK